MKKKHKIRNILLIILIAILLVGVAYYFYITYNEIDITPQYDISRTGTTVDL